MLNLTTNYTIRPLGDSAIVIQLGNDIDPIVHEKLSALLQAVEQQPFAGFIEALPAYTSITIYYNPIIVHKQLYPKIQQTSYIKVHTYIEKLLTTSYTTLKSNKRIIEIPVYYGDKHGPDLEIVASHNELKPEDVIRLHSEKEYLVYMLGFAPGFPFLGGMDEQIATPRKESPRLAIPKGSVGIAGQQTGIYPFETPGGWQIIGRTPIELFLPDQDPPTLLQAGDKIRFVPITHEQYKAYQEVKQ